MAHSRAVELNNAYRSRFTCRRPRAPPLGMAGAKAKSCTTEGSRQQAAVPKSEMHTSQRLAASRSSTFGALTSRCTICEHPAHTIPKEAASPGADVVGSALLYCTQFKGEA